jgi:hypothetical protein
MSTSYSTKSKHKLFCLIRKLNEINYKKNNTSFNLQNATDGEYKSKKKYNKPSKNSIILKLSRSKLKKKNHLTLNKNISNCFFLIKYLNLNIKCRKKFVVNLENFCGFYVNCNKNVNNTTDGLMENKCCVKFLSNCNVNAKRLFGILKIDEFKIENFSNLSDHHIANICIIIFFLTV